MEVRQGPAEIGVVALARPHPVELLAQRHAPRFRPPRGRVRRAEQVRIRVGGVALRTPVAKQRSHAQVERNQEGQHPHGRADTQSSRGGPAHALVGEGPLVERPSLRPPRGEAPGRTLLLSRAHVQGIPPEQLQEQPDRGEHHELDESHEEQREHHPDPVLEALLEVLQPARETRADLARQRDHEHHDHDAHGQGGVGEHPHEDGGHRRAHHTPDRRRARGPAGRRRDGRPVGPSRLALDCRGSRYDAHRIRTSGRA